MAESVVISRSYLDTLLRRAHLHGDDEETTSPHDLHAGITPSDLETLRQEAREYTNLKNNLFRGGIEQETLNILIQDHTQAQTQAQATEPMTSVPPTTNTDSTAFLTQPLSPVSSHHDHIPRHRMATFDNMKFDGYREDGGDNRYDFDQRFFDDDFGQAGDHRDVFAHENNISNNASDRRPVYDKYCKRTIVLGNLHEMTTYADITGAVRGGILLDIFLRSHDRTANISFLLEDNAQDFYRYVKRHDLYIHGRRVEVRWYERQFVLPGHVAKQVGMGATRNLVIHHGNVKQTEKEIRDHLEHIHNLTVIKISFNAGECYISTNSVHNAMYARNCMMSRTCYRGYRIDWAPDECAAPFKKHRPTPKNQAPKKPKPTPPTNRFELLDMADEGVDSKEV